MSQSQEDTNTAAGSGWAGYAQLGIVLAVIVVALSFARAPGQGASVGGSAPVAAAAPPMVRVIDPAPTDRSLTVRVTGNVGVRASLSVSAETSGRITWISPNFRSGGSLSAGEVVVRLEQDDLTLGVEAARLAVQAAEAGVRIEAQRAAVAERLLAGREPNVGDFEWVGRADALERARFNLERQRIFLELAERQLAKTEVAVPFASRVVSADVEIGELVSPGSGLGTVYRGSALEVTAPIDPRDLEYLSPVIGREARITTADGREFEAEVARVSAGIAPGSRLATVYLRFSGDADALPLPGTFVEAEITGPVRQNVYVLPNETLQEQDSVWVVSGGVLTSIAPQTVGRTADGWVVNAFDAGEGVVVGGLPRAREGLAVAVRRAET